MTTDITVVGGGIAGLVAAITCAESDTPVRLLEAHRMLGGRARSTSNGWGANLGPHVLYANGRLWPWLAERGLVDGVHKAPLLPTAVWRHRGRSHRVPPRAFVRAGRLVRRTDAPVDADFRSWAVSVVGDEAAEVASRAAGVFTFDADPGRLSAAFVVERARQAFTLPAPTRYVPGGWNTLVDRLASYAHARGVRIETGAPVTALPDPPVIVATPLETAARLLGDPHLCWEGTRTALLDVGLRGRRRTPFIVWDLDESGWVEDFSRPSPDVAPPGHRLLQAQLGMRKDETLEQAVGRLEALLDAGVPGWREREVWRRRSAVTDASGALDLPGTTWRDRPAVDRGDGVWVAGDKMAAPGTLSDVSMMSGVEAGKNAVEFCRSGHTSFV